MNKGKDLTEVRSPQRQLAPDMLDWSKRANLPAGNSNQGRVSVDNLALRESEYDRGTGCGKTARPGLCRGRRVTGVPTADESDPLILLDS